jgi:hypothetical protein
VDSAAPPIDPAPASTGLSERSARVANAVAIRIELLHAEYLDLLEEHELLEQLMDDIRREASLISRTMFGLWQQQQRLLRAGGGTEVEAT